MPTTFAEQINNYYGTQIGPDGRPIYWPDDLADFIKDDIRLAKFARAAARARTSEETAATIDPPPTIDPFDPVPDLPLAA